mmetsp:Transcript_41602/g.98584  ORF Transcript_41602/g.98584 Transcript_41602/m.98584 type:complete len:385 (-) Transcript_41602:3-1157(-)
MGCTWPVPRGHPRDATTDATKTPMLHSNLDNHLPGVPPRLLHPERLPDRLCVELQLPRHHGGDLALAHELQDRLVPLLNVALQARVVCVGGTRGRVQVAVDSPLEEREQQREHFPEVLYPWPRVLQSDADEPAPALGRLHRSAAARGVPVRGCAVEIEDEIRRCCLQRGVFPPLCPRSPVDHRISTQGGGQVHRTGDCQHVAGTELPLEQLEEEAADAPARVDDHHAIPWPDVFLERVGSQSARRHRGSVDHGHRIGNLGNVLGQHQAELGEGVKRPGLGKDAGDAVAHPEPGFPGVDLHHHPARIATRDIWEALWRLHERGHAAQHSHVPRRQRHGASLDQECSRLRDRGPGILRIDRERVEVLVPRDGARLHPPGSKRFYCN